MNVANTPQANTSWVLPESASTIATGWDQLFYFVLGLCAVFFLLVVVTMTIFVVKYRHRREGERTSPLKGNVPLEIAWIVIPSALLLVLFVWGFRSYIGMSVPPADAIDIRVTAQQWMWTFEYTRQGIRTTGDLVVPVGRPVRLTMSSVDVIHGFFVPAFRIKKDVVPNRYSVVWFEATKTGTFDVECTQYCGLEHSGMLGHIIVKNEQEYEEWLKTGGNQSEQGLSPAALGEREFSRQGCSVCHAVDASIKVGPSLRDKYGTIETLVGGKKVLVDDNFIREHLMTPSASIAVGFPDAMPSYQGRLNDKQINALIDYLRSLSTVGAASHGKR